MDIKEKLEILADAAKYDASCSSSGVKRKNKGRGIGNSTGAGICHSYTPDGRCVSLLKILLTNYCVYDCQYCINRLSSDVPRARFEPEEVVRLTMDFYKRNYIEGLFLSSGIIRSGEYTMEQLIKVAKTLRLEHDFRGYIHLKTVPGVAPELVEEAGRWADRLSVNIELPTQADLDELAPAKTIDEAQDTMGEIQQRVDEYKHERRRSKSIERFAPGGQSTQMIVGATPSSDASILQTASQLYTGYKLKRVYYSAFSPIPDSAASLPSVAPPLEREHRLYQADWLMRFYGFGVEELTTADAPNLALDIDPKLAWALRNRQHFPVDVNTAPREMLLRIPGVGARSVEKILATRRHRTLTLDDLARMRVVVKRAAAFMTVGGPNQMVHSLDDLDLRLKLKSSAVQGSLFGGRIAG